MVGKIIGCVLLIGIGCKTPSDEQRNDTQSVRDHRSIDAEQSADESQSSGAIHGLEVGSFDQRGAMEGVSGDGLSANPLCNGSVISAEAVDMMLILTETTDAETIYSTYARIDGIASLFEECGDPWGMFPTAYRHITRRIIQAIDGREIEDEQWGRDIVLDFAARYLENLEAALKGEQPSYAWEQYYYLADRQDVSRTRAVVVAMVAHLTLDLPYALVAIDSREDQKDDYFVLGELMIEITPDFLDELLYFYGCDAEEILNGFFFGDWVDGAFGPDTTITLSYQTIRTKSWNNRWYLEQSWGGWVARSEIYTAFWAIDGVLAGLDASGAI